MKPTFESTVSILVKAYLNDTLEVGNFCACAVGNLIADAVGAELVPVKGASVSKYKWRHPEYVGSEWYQSPTSITARSQIRSTGYSFQEIWAIEKAFEKVRRMYCGTKDEEMFQGLMNVIDVLADIHGIDLKTRESAKLQFVKTENV